MDLHGLQGDSLPHHDLLHGLPLCSSAWSTTSPSFFTDLGVCRAVSLTYSSSSLLIANAVPQEGIPFLNMLSQRRYRCHRWAWPWPAAGPSWNWLALALSDTAEASHSFSQKPPLQAPPLPKPCHTNPQHSLFSPPLFHHRKSRMTVSCAASLLQHWRWMWNAPSLFSPAQHSFLCPAKQGHNSYMGDKRGLYVHSDRKVSFRSHSTTMLGGTRIF